MAAPTLQTGAGNVTTASGTSGTNITVSKPANTANGDLLVFWVGCQNNSGGTDFTVPSVAAGTVVRMGTAYNVSGDGNRRPAGWFALPVPSAAALTDTTFQFTATTGSGRYAIWCARVTGAHASSYVDSYGTWYATSNDSSQSRAIPGCTTTQADTLLLAGIWWQTNSSPQTTNTWAAGPTEIADFGTASGTQTHSTMSVAYETVSSAGATGTRTVTLSGSGTVANGNGYVVAIASATPATTQLSARIIAHRATTAAQADTTEEQLTGLTVLKALSPLVNGGEVDVRRPSDYATTGAGKSFLMHDTTPDRTSPNGSTAPSVITNPANAATYTSWQMCELTTWLDGWLASPPAEILVQLEIDAQAEMVDPIKDCLAHPLRDRIMIMTSATSGATPRPDRIRGAGWTGRLGCYGVDSATYSTYSADFVTYDVDTLFLPLGDAGWDGESANVATYQGAGYRVGASTITMAKVADAISDGATIILTDYSEQFTTLLPPDNGGFLDGRGTGTAAATVTKVGSGTLAVTGTGTAAATLSIGGAGTLTATGTRTAVANLSTTGAASFTATGTITAAAAVTRPAQASPSGTATITAAAALTLPVAASFTATATTAATGTVSSPGQVAVDAALVVTGTLAAAAAVTRPAAATFTATATLAAVAYVARFGASSLTGTATLTAAASVVSGEPSEDSTGSMRLGSTAGPTMRPRVTAAASMRTG